MNLSFLIGKIVLNTKGEIIGYARYPVFSNNFTRLIAMQCTDLKESPFLLSIEFIPPENKPFIYAKKSEKTMKKVYSPLGKTAYSQKGEKLGTVTDLYLCGTQPKFLMIDGKPYSTQLVSAFGDCIILNFRKKIKNDDPFSLLGKRVKSDMTVDERYRFKKGETISGNALQLLIQQKKLLELTVKSL